MKRITLILCAACAILLASCGGPNREQSIKEIEQCENLLMSDAAMAGIDMNKATEMVTLYKEFVHNFPNDSLAPIFLYKAADISYNTNHVDSAIALFSRITEEYEDFAELGTCYFMIGEGYNTLGKFEEAQAAYENFVRLFPDHPLAADTRYLLENKMIGMSPEQALEMILANKEDQ